MKVNQTPKPKVVAVERHGGDLLITFDNGRAAVYSAAVLYALIGHAKELKTDELPN